MDGGWMVDGWWMDGGWMEHERRRGEALREKTRVAKDG